MCCSKCGSENPAGKKYCSECGVELLMRRPRCNAENAPAAKFCGECGAPCDSSIGTPVTATPQLQSAEVLGEGIAEQLLQLAERRRDPQQLLWANSRMATVSF